MGEVDILSRKYMSDRNHFADTFNYYLYDGRAEIDPNDLSPLDTSEIAVPYGNGARVPVQKYRDVIKYWKVMTDGKALYAILGIEAQANVHYAMPVKNGLYDLMNYSRQVEEARNSYRLKNGKGRNKNRNNRRKKMILSPAEYLSGFRKEDRLIPVITLVVFFSASEWDGPMSIHEMLCTDDETLLQYVPDYRIHLLEPYKMENSDFEKFQTDFGKVLKYIKYSGDKDKLHEITHDSDAYKSIDNDSAVLMNAVTGSKLKIKPEEVKVDMCKAIDDMRKESREEGKIEGRIEGKTEGIELVVGLMQKLYSLGRNKDAQKAVYDERFRNRLYEEFNLLRQ